jgi:tetratricopeptide (TPR) repeat protein
MGQSPYDASAAATPAGDPRSPVDYDPHDPISGAGRGDGPGSPDQAAQCGAGGRLRELRLRRFWTQADFAAAFEARSRQIGRPLSLSVRQVRRWESESPPLPLPAYQAVLEALFAVPIEQLGFQPQWSDPAPHPDLPGAAPAHVPREAGETECARSPHDDLERHDPVRRRDFMAGAAGLGSTVLLPGPASPGAGAQAGRPPARPGMRGAAAKVDPALVAGYAAIADHHRALYWTVQADAMFAPVAAHSELGLGLLADASSPALRSRLAAPVAQSAMLAARLSFFDLQRADLAEGYYAAALDAAREAGDPALTGAVLTHMAFLPAYAGRARRARALIAEAHHEDARGASPVQRSWTYAVEAELEAKLGNPTAADDLIARAEDMLGVTDPHSLPPWLDFYDASRLDGFKGFCRLAAGRSRQAAASLEQTLRDLPATADKQRSIVFADLALARAQQREHEESARLLGQALTQLASHWYALGVRRVDAVRRKLGASGAPASVTSHLDEARACLRPVAG